MPQHIWPQLQSPSVLSMSPISGPCQTNGSWQLTPGHVPQPLSGLPWLVEPRFLASSKTLLSINGGLLLSRSHSLKTVNWDPPECWEPLPSLSQPINRGNLSLPVSLLSSACPWAVLCLRWCPCSTPLWAVSYSLLAGICLCLFLTNLFFLPVAVCHLY